MQAGKLSPRRRRDSWISNLLYGSDWVGLEEELGGPLVQEPECQLLDRFRQCLQNQQDSISDIMGVAFFNVLEIPCFVLEEQEACVAWYWWGGYVLWAAVVFPAAEIRTLEDPCKKQRGAPAQQGWGCHTLAMPTQCRNRDLVLAPALPQTPWVASGHSPSGGLSVSKLEKSNQAQPLLGSCKCQAAHPGALVQERDFLRGSEVCLQSSQAHAPNKTPKL